MNDGNMSYYMASSASDKISQILHCDWSREKDEAILSDKSFMIDEACSVKIVGSSCSFLDLDGVSIHKHAKNKLGSI